MDSNHFICACRISLLKKFQVLSFKFKVLFLLAFALNYYSLSNKLYERCVVLIVIRVLVFYLNLSSAFLTPPLGGGWGGLCGE